MKLWKTLLLIFLIFGFAGLSASAAGCVELATFGELSDLYARARKPTADEVATHTWKMVAIGPHESPLGLGRAFESSGYSVNDVVPKLTFKRRAALHGQPQFGPLLSWCGATLFASREDWGKRNLALPILPTFFPGHWDAPIEKRNSLTFSFTLFEANGPELFLATDEFRLGQTKMYFYCRILERSLVCMGEYFSDDPQARPKITDYFLWDALR